MNNIQGKIIDCFIFYNELDMLSYRLKVLNDYVDYFVLVEAKYTHKGNDKKLYFNENKNKFRKYLHKIIHVIVEDVPDYKILSSYKTWSSNKIACYNEIHHRNCIKRGLNDLALQDNDLIIISDADEIPNPKKFHLMKKDEINSMQALLYYYNLTCVGHYSNKLCPKLLTFKKLSQYSCQSIRKKVQNIIPKSAWHLSYFGNSDFIINKISEYSHCGDGMVSKILNSNNPEKEINNRIKESRDLFSVRGSKFRHLKIQDNKDLPPFINFFKNYE